MIEPTYYHDYLQLNKVLGAQEPRSKLLGGPAAHDEHLFIVIHQVYELWFKQILHEVNSVRAIFEAPMVTGPGLGLAVHRLRRVVEIQKILIDQIRVLETMTSLDFLEFRNYLFPASGFQSMQFRLFENALGMDSERRIQYRKCPYHSHLTSDQSKIVQDSETVTSLRTLIQGWLERLPFLEFQDFDFWTHYRSAVDTMLDAETDAITNNPILGDEERSAQLKEHGITRAAFDTIFDEEKHQELLDSNRRSLSHKATLAALFIKLYRDEPLLQMPHALLQVLVEIDENLVTWRYRHATMVQRMIGTKIGTGGSSGYYYLKSTVDERYKVFLDLYNLSTYLVPRYALPALPTAVRQNLGFFNSAENVVSNPSAFTAQPTFDTPTLGPGSTLSKPTPLKK